MKCIFVIRCFWKGKNAVQTVKKISAVYRDDVAESIFCKWFVC